MWKCEIRRACKMIGVLLLVSGLTACGGEYAGTMEGEVVSGSAVSGDAVSGSAFREEAVSGGALKKESSDIKKKSGKNIYRFATDTNYYSCNYSADATICQYRLDMTQKKEIPMLHKNVSYFELICVEDGFLYYRTNQEKKGKDLPVSKIFRVPLEKDAEGYDVVKTEEKEEILTDTKSIWGCSVYMNSRYICYLRGERNKNTFVKYDRKTGKEFPVEALPMDTELAETVTGYGDWIFVMNMDEICFQKLDETKWHKIERERVYRVYNGNAIFDTGRDENGRSTDIYKYNLKAGKWQSYVSIKELEKAAQTAIGSDQTEQLECRVERLSCQGDRLYIQACVIWMEDGVYHVRYLFFYRGEEDDAVCYEKGLFECVHSHVTENAGKWTNAIKGGQEQIVLEDASWTDIINGKVFLAFYDDEKEEGRLGCYELDTGDFRWLTKQDAEYYEPCYGTTENWNVHSFISSYEPASFSSFPSVILPGGVYVR